MSLNFNPKDRNQRGSLIIDRLQLDSYPLLVKLALSDVLIYYVNHCYFNDTIEYMGFSYFFDEMPLDGVCKKYKLIINKEKTPLGETYFIYFGDKFVRQYNIEEEL